MNCISTHHYDGITKYIFPFKHQLDQLQIPAKDVNDDNGGDDKKGSEDNVGFIRNGSPIFFQTEGKSFSKHKLFNIITKKESRKCFPVTDWK